MAFKMATGSGKTVVMAMLIAWHTLNKQANPQDGRFSDTFLIVTPGITIRDRLRVLFPNDPENYYRQRDLVSAQQQEQLGQAKIIITNYHAFQLREKVAAGKITKSILADGQHSPFIETPDEMVRRVCRELSTKKNIIILNDYSPPKRATLSTVLTSAWTIDPLLGPCRDPFRDRLGGLDVQEVPDVGDDLQRVRGGEPMSVVDLRGEDAAVVGTVKLQQGHRDRLRQAARRPKHAGSQHRPVVL
jgi:Type III restriction enzyme, res subunit